MEDAKIKQVVAELEQDGWPEMPENEVLTELARQIRDASPKDAHLGENDNWRARAGQLAGDVWDRIEERIDLDPNIASITIETLTMVIIQQCIDLITRACGGQTVNQQFTVIIAAYLALVIFQRLKAQ